MTIFILESCAYQVLNSGGEYGGAPIVVQAAKYVFFLV